MWSHIVQSSPLWPQPRDSHTICIVVCDNQEIKVLLLGGVTGGYVVLSDCWLLDVIRGIGEKVRKKREGELWLALVIGN